MSRTIKILTGLLLVLIALTGPKTAAQDVRRGLGSVARVLAGNGTLTAPSYSFVSDTGTGFFRTAASSVGYVTSGVVRVLFNGATSLQLGSGVPLAWPSTVDATGAAADTGLSRTAVGTVSVGNGTPGDASGTIVAAGASVTSNLAMSSAARIFWSTRAQITSPSDGNFVINNNALTIGSELKADALPTAGTCGTSPAVTAGSTPLAGSINVGTGGTATSCTVTFNGTAFPSAPFCLASPTTTNAVTRASASTTVLTLTTTTAWTASDVVNWVCISSK